MSPPEASRRDGRGRAVAWGTSAAVLIGVLLRTVYLDADPDYYAWIGYITDEGRWIETARSLILVGNPADYGFNVHFWVAPLFQLAHVPVFALLGVSFWSSRLLSSLAGSALLVWLAVRLRDRVPDRARFLGVALLAAQADLVMLGRVTAPETASMLAQTAVFVTLVLGVEDRRKIVRAALLMIIALLVKATAFPLIVAFTLVVIALPRTGRAAGSTRRRLGDGAVFAGVVAAPAALAVVVASISGSLVWVDQLQYVSRLFRAPLGGKSLFLIANHPFDSLLSPVLNAFALGAWIGGLAWWATGSRNLGVVPRRLFCGALIWWCGWYVPMSLLGYFPHRYQAHLLVPFALTAVFAVTVLERVGFESFRDSLSGRRGLSRVTAALGASIPVGTIVAPLVMAAASSVGFDAERLRSKLLVVVLGCALVAAVVGAGPRLKSSWNFLLTYPFVFATSWLVSIAAGLDGGFWPEAGGSALARRWALVAGVALLVWVTASLVARTGRVWFRKNTPVMLGAVVLLSSVVSIAPGLLRPTYTMRDASREIGRLVGDSPPVTSVLASSMFLGNDLAFRGHYRFPVLRDPAPYAVFLDDQLRRGDVRRAMYHEYSEVRAFYVNVSPDYRRRNPRSDGAEVPFVAVVLVRRNDPRVGESGAAPGELPVAP